MDRNLDHGVVFKRVNSRTPHGVRGSKIRLVQIAAAVEESHPAWGAWIEIDKLIVVDSGVS